MSADSEARESSKPDSSSPTRSDRSDTQTDAPKEVDASTKEFRDSPTIPMTEEIKWENPDSGGSDILRNPEVLKESQGPEKESLPTQVWHSLEAATTPESRKAEVKFIGDVLQPWKLLEIDETSKDLKHTLDSSLKRIHDDEYKHEHTDV